MNSSSRTNEKPSRVDGASADEVARLAAIRAMQERGLMRVEELLEFASVPAILATCRWFDDHRNAGTGALAKAIRAGGMPNYKPRKQLLQEQQDYGHSIVKWLNRHFPDLNAHPAAIAAVIRLHYLVGKGKLTPSEHGETIRGAVARWEEIA